MGNLFLSFMIAVGGAAGLFTLGRTLNFDVSISHTFPLIPIIYAIVYEFLEKKRGGKGKNISQAKPKEETKPVETEISRNITVIRIVTAVGISFAIKFSLEIIYTALFTYINGQPLADIYSNVSIETIGKFLKGEHLWLTEKVGIYLLSIIAFTTSLGTGLWIGYTSKGKAILEGVLVGAVVTLITAMTNMLMLYQRIEELANKTAASMGYAIQIGFVIVITAQVLLYGLWSGLIQKSKQERAVLKKSRK